MSLASFCCLELHVGQGNFRLGHGLCFITFAIECLGNSLIYPLGSNSEVVGVEPPLFHSLIENCRIARLSHWLDTRARRVPPKKASFGAPVSSRFRFDGAKF